MSLENDYYKIWQNKKILAFNNKNAYFYGNKKVDFVARKTLK
jgi:hypothetical protein